LDREVGAIQDIMAITGVLRSGIGAVHTPTTIRV